MGHAQLDPERDPASLIILNSIKQGGGHNIFKRQRIGSAEKIVKTWPIFKICWEFSRDGCYKSVSCFISHIFVYKGLLVDPMGPLNGLYDFLASFGVCVFFLYFTFSSPSEHFGRLFFCHYDTAAGLMGHAQLDPERDPASLIFWDPHGQNWWIFLDRPLDNRVTWIYSLL